MYTSSVEEVNSTRRKFRIAVEPKTVSEAFNSAIQEVQQNANIKGFRKGKAPAALVRKFFDQDVRKKALENVVEKTYQNAISKADFQIVSYPHIENDGAFQDGSEFKFTATVDINPMVDIKGYKELTLKHDGVTVDEATVQKEIDNLSKAVSTFEKITQTRAVEKNDFVVVNYEGSVDGKPVKGGPIKNQRLDAGEGRLLPEFEKAILGAKIGETREFDVTYPATYDEVTLRGKTAHFKLTVTAIEQRVAPTLDDEFAKRFGTESMDALKTSIKEMISNRAETEKLQVLQEQIVDQILAKNEFEVPESLIENTVDRAIEMENQENKGNAPRVDPADESARAKHRDWAKNQVKGVLALGHVARAEGITVEDKELGPELAGYARSVGMDVQSLLNKGGQQVIEEVRGRVLLNKTVKHLVGLNKVESAKA